MANRDESVSPMNRSPRSLSPMTRPNPDGALLGVEAPERGPSPLRTEHKLDGSIETTKPENTRPTLAISPSSPNGTTHPPNTSRMPSGYFGLRKGDKSKGNTGVKDVDGPVEAPTYPAMPPDGQATDPEPEGSGALPGRRSVQFSRAMTTDIVPPAPGRHSSWDTQDSDTADRERQGSRLFSKLKALATPTNLQTHGRSASTGGTDDAGVARPQATTSESTTAPSLGRGEESEADADVEESGGEGLSRPNKRRRKSRRMGDNQTAPTTPRSVKFPSRAASHTDSPEATPTSTVAKPSWLSRRATMNDIPEHENGRLGVSEDEGRDRLAAKDKGWRRGLHGPRGLTYTGARRNVESDTPEGRRPSQFRRFTGMGSHTAGTEASPSAWRQRAERTSSISAQKWRQIKAGLRAMGRNKRQENRVDQQKSAELLAELLAGAPAALFMASMFQRDEHGNKRVPVLLEQLKLKIVDSQRVADRSGDRHVVFHIELEYGSGLTRMKWVVHRSLRDFANLHVKYKAASARSRYGDIIQARSTDPNKAKLPRFPRSAFPYLRGIRGLYEDEEEVDEATEGEASGNERTKPPARRTSSFARPPRRKSSVGSPLTPTQNGQPGIGSRMSSFPSHPERDLAVRQDYTLRQREKLEDYLHRMITFLMFRPDSNRLCKFLELSALGIRLAVDGGYHGKEGLLSLLSASNNKGLDYRKRLNPAHVASLGKRHKPKWFLVRQNYIVSIESPESMDVADVFLVDAEFSVEHKSSRLGNQSARDVADRTKAATTHGKHHLLRLSNSERRLKLLAKNDRQLAQFETSLKFMMSHTEWAKPHRFESFAPVRHKVFAQWLVDGRDFMWNASRAISMATDVIYIHDWWLSPELYMRRPPAISQKWRLDRLLKRKAEEGVKIFVIMYRNINSAIPIDSEYSKFALLDLHPNIFVQRSPNQFKQNQFFWSHHEKILVIDHTVGFCGGVDLCFGRWDVPNHPLVDDKQTGFELNDAPKDADHCQLWPGKDYSNPRVQDFYSLDKPYEEMYDRTRVPRMPWHDIGMQIVGQPARDLTRHFVQRWNYLLRNRKPTRPTPMLLPPPDFNQSDIEALGLEGTCEIQILRSACEWSLGTPGKVEKSIQNAYIKLIQTSEHFVYIENQFFITSCDFGDTRILNSIGDALVDRIKRAHRNDEDWRACIVVPLMPGYQNTVDQQDGTSVRLIMSCQFKSICRGDSSIFERLRAASIEPEDYIQFYSLRQWGKIGPNKALTTEQLYIHAKCMVVDDRAAIIGSANINERSMNGDRDSEVAAIIRDTEMIPSYMAGRPYKVGRFPHTLRMRLMREHLGIDVDDLADEAHTHGFEQDEDSGISVEDLSAPSSPTLERETEQRLVESRHKVEDELIARVERLHSFNHDIDWEQDKNPNIQSDKKKTSDRRVTDNPEHEKDVRGEGPDNMLAQEARAGLGSRDSTLTAEGREILVASEATEGKGTLTTPKKHKSQSKRERRETFTSHSAPTSPRLRPEGNASLPPPRFPRMDTQALGLTQLSQLPPLPDLDDTDIGGPPLQQAFSPKSLPWLMPLLANMKRPIVTPDCMRDPLNDSFYVETWHAVAETNTKIYRQVFRCMPDNEVKTWKDYKEYETFLQRFQESMGLGKQQKQAKESDSKTGPPGSGAEKTIIANASSRVGTLGEKIADLLPGHHHAADGTVHSPLGDIEPVQNPLDKVEIDEKDALKHDESKTPSPPVHEEDVLTEKPTNNTASTTATAEPLSEKTTKTGRDRTVTYSEGTNLDGAASSKPTTNASTSGSQRRRRRATTKSSTRAFHANDEHAMLSKEDAEELLKLVQGSLVVWPYDWLEQVDRTGGWFYAVDQIAPLEIYS